MAVFVLVLCIGAYFAGYAVGWGINKGSKRTLIDPTWLGLLGVVLLTGFYAFATFQAFEAHAAREAGLSADVVRRAKVEALASVLLPGIFVFAVAGGRAWYKRLAK